MDSTSSFSKVRQPFPDAELLKVGGSTCECYRVRLYGKLHFLKRLKPELRTDLVANQQNIPKGELTKTVNMEESNSSAKSYAQSAPSSPAQSIMPTVQATPSQSHSQATPSTPAQSESSVAGTQSHKAESSAADLASLHRLLDNAIRPIFEEFLGAYKNRDYYHLDKEELKEYTEQHLAYHEACLNKFNELWKTHQHQYDKELFYAEGWKTHDSYDSLTFLPSRLSHK